MTCDEVDDVITSVSHTWLARHLATLAATTRVAVADAISLAQTAD